MQPPTPTGSTGSGWMRREGVAGRARRKGYWNRGRGSQRICTTLSLFSLCEVPGAMQLLSGSAIEGDTPMPTQSRVAIQVLPHWLIGAALLAGATVGYAGNLNFLKETPISYMRETDQKALNDPAQTALETKNDGATLQWNNAGTGNPASTTRTV